MKKVISLLLAVLMLVSVVPMAASAATQSYYEDGLYYSVDDNGTKTVTDVADGVEYVVVPEGVHKIGRHAFAYNDDIKVVVLPSSLTRIEAQAFLQCKKLESVYFTAGKDSLTITNYAFHTCQRLDSIFLPKNVYTYTAAFYRCNTLSYVGIAYGASSGRLANRTFDQCSLLNYITYVIPAGVGEKWPLSHYLGAAEGVKFHSEHSYSTYTRAKPHCMAKGFKSTACWCGYLSSYEILDKDMNNHVKSVHVQKKYDPTCIADGHTKREYCNYCGIWFNEGEPIPATGHKAVTDKAVAATCTKNGRTEGSHCFVCGVVLVEQTSIPMLDHIDENHDGKCDYGCRYDFTSGCSHLCHKGGFFYKIALFFWKLFKINKECSCGMYHY